MYARTHMYRLYLLVYLCLSERDGARLASVFDDPLLLLVRVQDLQKRLVDVGVVLETILEGRGGGRGEGGSNDYCGRSKAATRPEI